MDSRKVSRRGFLKSVGVVGLGAASLQVLAACAPAGVAPAAGDSSEGAPAAEMIVLRVQVPPEGGQSIMPIQMGERFTEETGIGVEVEETIYGEIETKTQTGFISGTLPDLLYGHHRWLFNSYLKGIYMEIDDFIASSPPDDYDDMYPSVMAGNSLNGKNFSMPGVVHPGGNIAVMFNKTMLEEKGIPLPEEGWTFDQWTEMAKAAADPDNGIFGLGFDGMNSFHYYSNTSRLGCT